MSIKYISKTKPKTEEGEVREEREERGERWKRGKEEKNGKYEKEKKEEIRKKVEIEEIEETEEMRGLKQFDKTRSRPAFNRLGLGALMALMGKLLRPRFLRHSARRRKCFFLDALVSPSNYPSDLPRPKVSRNGNWQNSWNWDNSWKWANSWN